MTRVLVLNGPNLNLLGTREPHLYGAATLADIEAELVTTGEAWGVEVRCVQSNHEGVLIDAIHAAREDCDGIVINPAAYTHTSVALRDALLAAALPTVEIHLSNVAGREAFRQRSLVSDIVVGTIGGFGPYGYRLALDALRHHLTERAVKCIRPTSSARV